MKKEKLTIQNIARDLVFVSSLNKSRFDEWRMSYIAPVTALAVILGVILKNIWVGLLIFSFAAYHIYHYIGEIKEYRARKKTVIDIRDRIDIAISVETFSHVAEETVYEPHSHGRHHHDTKIVKFFRFEGGGEWRIPEVSKHYGWSKDYHVSTKGLENISLKGDKFFYVALKEHYDIAYIYPCKFFELDASLAEEQK